MKCLLLTLLALTAVPLLSTPAACQVDGAMTQDSRRPAEPDNGSQGDPQNESFQGRSVAEAAGIF